MFATSLFPLPPPSGSMLPAFSQPQSEPTQQSHSHHSQSRRKPTNRHNTPLTVLSHDERLVASRKLAIAMYGYSWLKPAGCNKTMLGRREEELEREEVERQLREVELQERMAMEQEEQERREELGRQADGGEVEGVGDRDLDDGIPDADEEEEGDESDGEDIEDEEDMDGDLDDEVPDADTEGLESSWVYDTRRESDTESEEENNADDNHDRFQTRPQPPRQVAYPDRDDSAATEAMVNAMLDEDEIGEYEHQHDLDDDVPDMDADMDMDMDASLSDEIASAPASPGWEHTDSELEESEMDISLLPPYPSSRSRNPGTTHEEMRRVSGNRMPPPALPPTGSSNRGSGIERRGQGQDQAQRPPPPRTAPRRTLRTMMRTPATADEISALISTGGTSTIDTGPAESSVEPQSPNRRSWLNPSGARRNLFSGLRGNLTATLGGSLNPGQPQSQTQIQSSQTQGQLPARTATQGVSSGGLFTPSPRVADLSDSDEEEHTRRQEEPRSRTRSGRLLGGLQVGVERRLRRRDGET